MTHIFCVALQGPQYVHCQLCQILRDKGNVVLSRLVVPKIGFLFLLSRAFLFLPRDETVPLQSISWYNKMKGIKRIHNILIY